MNVVETKKKRCKIGQEKYDVFAKASKVEHNHYTFTNHLKTVNALADYEFHKAKCDDCSRIEFH